MPGAAIRVARSWVVVIALTVGLPFCLRAQIATSGSPIPDTIAGTIRRSTGEPVIGATVMLTRAPDMEVRRAASDSLGRFSFMDPGGSGEYILTVGAEGFKPLRRRVVGTPRSMRTELIISLDAWITTLQAVEVTAKRRPPEAGSGFEVGAGATEGLADGALAVGPALVDNLSAISRASLAGVAAEDGWAVAGLSGRESQTQLNGLLFRGTELPRTLPRRTRLSASSYDVANGGFSGGLIAIELPRAGEFRDTNLEASAGLFPVGFGDQRQATAGPRAPEAAVDLGGGWRNQRGTTGISAGVRASAQQMPRTFLGHVSDATVASFGADPQVARAASALIANRLPAGAVESLGGSQRFRLSMLARIDPHIRAEDAGALIVGLSLAAEPVDGGTPLAEQTHGGNRKRAELVTQWQRNWVSRSNALWDWRTGVSLSNEKLDPHLPEIATLLVSTRATNMSPESGAPVLLGGTPGRETTSRILAETHLQRDAFVGARGSHRVRGFVAARLDAMRRQRPPAAAVLGFESLADLEASTPQWSATKTGPKRGRADVLRGSAGVGDEWAVHSRVRLQYGIRIDAQSLRRPTGAWLSEPDAALSDWGAVAGSLSPRLGLSWAVRPATSGAGYSTSNLFQKHLVPAGVLRIGVGLFQRDLEPDVVLQRASAWGPITTRWCPAGANPVQTWTPDALAAASIARNCLTPPDGSGGTDRLVREVFDRSFTAPASIRATASFLTQVRALDLELTALWNESRRQPGRQDLSLSPQPRSFIFAEGGRAFFSPDISIDAATGVVRPDLGSQDARVQNDLLVTSDRRSRSTQFTIQVSPHRWRSRKMVRVGYSWLRSRVLAGGWDSDTFGNPFRLEWGPGPLDNRHQLQVETAREIFGGVSLIFWARAASGAPISALVAGDVNGDGNSRNDRAFIPARQIDAGRDAGIDFGEVVGGAPRRIVQCLESQAGRPAGRGSCRGPWSLASNFLLAVEAGRLGLGSRGTVNLSIENVGAFADRALHGKNTHGWGLTGSPDPVLLRVTGFDPSRRAFRYSVNPRFGRIPTGFGSQANAPRLSISFSIPLSAPIQHQQVERWLRARGVGERLPAEDLAVRFARNVPSLYEGILGATDELLLEPEQLAWIAAARPTFEGGMNRIWTSLATELAALPAEFEVDDAVRRVETATDQAWELSRLEAHRLRDVLTPIQARLLPWPASVLMREDKAVRFRINYF